MDIAKVTEQYYANNAKKIHKMVDNIIRPFGGLSQKDIDDFYSLANEVFLHAINDFNGKGNFNGFLYSRLVLKIRSLMTERNRQKRSDVEVIIKEDGTEEKIYHPTLSLDAPIKNDEGENSETLGDITPSKFDLEKYLSKDVEITLNENIIKYLNKLTPTQRKIATLVMNGDTPEEIKSKLNISDKRYGRLICQMKSFDKKRILKENISGIVEEKKMSSVTTLETNKDEKLSVLSIIKKIDNYTVRFDHPLQRSSEQWDRKMKSNLVSDILQGNPLPEIILAEQVINNLSIVWDIDGKQRCTNVHDFKYDGFKISKNVTRGIITYQAIMRDDNDNPILDEKGFPTSERRSFDIRNKKYSELPEELQDRFNDYDFKIVKYLNCSSEDIAYHIERYNSGRPMNVSQRGVTKLGEKFAEMIKEISAMPFFREYGGYRMSDGKNGTLDRVVIESVMNINFRNQWVKDQGSMCSFLQENATEEMFERFEDIVDVLTEIGDEDFFNMFNAKNSFIYFAAYDWFSKSEKSESDFIGFMHDFEHELHRKNINGESFDSLNEKSTKDKNVVIKKMNLMIALMKEYFNISESDDVHKETTNDDSVEQSNMNNGGCEEDCDVLQFVQENVDPCITNDDVDDYWSMLDAYDIDKTSRLLDYQNEPSLVAIIAYSFINDITLDDWIKEYFSKNNMYFINQKKNYLHMKKDLENYIASNEKMAS